MRPLPPWLSKKSGNRKDLVPSHRSEWGRKASEGRARIVNPGAGEVVTLRFGAERRLLGVRIGIPTALTPRPTTGGSVLPERLPASPGPPSVCPRHRPASSLRLRRSLAMEIDAGSSEIGCGRSGADRAPAFEPLFGREVDRATPLVEPLAG